VHRLKVVPGSRERIGDAARRLRWLGTANTQPELSQGAKGGATMESENLRLNLAIALKTPEIRRACCAVERILTAVDILDELPPAALEELRDYCTDYNKGRQGVFSEFKHAYISVVADHLADMRLRERRLFHGITGKETAA
jgi:hypothetical protein